MEMKKTARTALLSALFTVLLAPGAFAEKSLSIDLQTAIDKAFKTHADIKKAEYALDADRASYNAARETFGPKVTFSHKTTRGGYWDEQIIGGVPTKNLGTSHTNGFNLSVPIFNPGLNAAEKQAKARYQSSVLGEELAFITITDSFQCVLYVTGSDRLSTGLREVSSRFARSSEKRAGPV